MAELYRSSPDDKLNILPLYAHAPTVFLDYCAMAIVIFTKLEVPPIEREQFVLVVAQV